MVTLPSCPFPKIEGFPVPKDDGLKLDLGCGEIPHEGFEGVDLYSAKATYRWDLERPFPDRTFFKIVDAERVPAPPLNESASCIVASHVLEHIRNLDQLMNECWRVLREGCYMAIRVPRCDHWSSIADPSHVRQFHPNSFLYYTPLCHYDNGVRPWHVERICWCEPTEIVCLMTPIKDEAKAAAQKRKAREYLREHNLTVYDFTAGEPRDK